MDKNYLKNTRHRVRLNNKYCNWKKVTSGTHYLSF